MMHRRKTVHFDQHKHVPSCLCNSECRKQKQTLCLNLRERIVNHLSITNNKENNYKSENLKSEIQLRSFRKRKMADKNDNNSSFKLKVPKLDLADEIQHQIDDQIRMREGAMKLMSVCGTLNQALETSKNLLTINARILGLMSALQKKKKQHVLQEYNRQRSSVCSESAVDSCTGKVAISDIRVPLMWKDNVHFTGKTGDQSYYAFALIRCGDKVRDTQLYEITSADTDMYFHQTLIFDDLPPDFKMDLEVYYTVITSNEAHGIRTPIRTSMNLRTAKKSIQFKAPKFCLAGHVQLAVDDIKKGMISRDLVMGGKGASGVAVLGDIQEFPIHPLELWGQICCMLAAQPQCMLEKVVTGSCEVKVDESWINYFCIIYQSAISCWIDETQSKISKPAYVMSYTDVKKVSQTEDGLQINLISSSGSILHSLKFDQADVCIKWVFLVRGAVVNFQSWKHACTELMHIEATKKHRLSIPTTASFYDQISIENESNGVSKRNGNILTPLLDNIDEKSEQVGLKTQQQEKVCADTSNTSIPSNSKDEYKLDQKKENEEEEFSKEWTQPVDTNQICDRTNEQDNKNEQIDEINVIAQLDEVISKESEEMKTSDEESESQTEDKNGAVTKKPAVEQLDEVISNESEEMKNSDEEGESQTEDKNGAVTKEPVVVEIATTVTDTNGRPDPDMGPDDGGSHALEKFEDEPNVHVNDEKIAEFEKSENDINESVSVEADSSDADCKTCDSNVETTDRNDSQAENRDEDENKELQNEVDIDRGKIEDTTSIDNDETKDETIHHAAAEEEENVEISTKHNDINILNENSSETVEQEKSNICLSNDNKDNAEVDNESKKTDTEGDCTCPIENYDVEKTSDIQSEVNSTAEDVVDSVNKDVNTSESDKKDEHFTSESTSDKCSPSDETRDVTTDGSKNENHTETDKNEKDKEHNKKVLVKQQSLSKIQTTV